MKKIVKFAELCALPIGSFVQIKSRKCEDYVVVMCPSNKRKVPTQASVESGGLCVDSWSELPVGALVVLYELQERVCFRARTVENFNLKDSMVRGEFESEGYRYEFYRLESEEICDLFLRMQSLSQGSQDVIKCLKDNVAKLEKRLS